MPGREVGERTRCASCQASIFWIETTNGKLMPVNTTPQLRLVRVLSVNHLLLADAKDEASYVRVRAIPTYVSHFSTCPNAGQHRRR